jgi:thiol-disulfide isomerase/thioredoxin
MARASILVIVAVIGFVGCHQAPANPSQPRKQAEQTTTPESRLPDFSVKDLQGKQISSSDLRGKVVLVDFWATWCGPCKQEMPGYQKLDDRYGSRGLRVIGLKLNTMQDTQPPLQFAKSIGVHYPLAIATEDLINKFGGIEGLPTTLLYDRHGNLRKKVIGFEYTHVFESALKPLL